MSTTIVETFKSAPAKVRAAIRETLVERVPEYAYLLEWDQDGTRSSGSRFGAKGSLELSGEGPTTVTLTFSIGFPASLKISEEKAETLLREAFREMKSKVP